MIGFTVRKKFARIIALLVVGMLAAACEIDGELGAPDDPPGIERLVPPTVPGSDDLDPTGAEATTTAAPATTEPPTPTTTAPSTTPPTTSGPPTTIAPPTTTVPAGDLETLFFEDFVADDSMSRIDHHLYHRDDNLMVQTTWGGDHQSIGPDDMCGPPEERRTITRGERSDDFNDEWIYRCVPGGDTAKAHFMTSIGDTSGYSIGAMSPAMTFTNVREVRWDVNQTDLGDRQFTEVAIIPVENFSFDRLPCQIGLPCGNDTGNGFGVNDDDTINHHEIGSVGTQWGGLRARIVLTPDMPTGYVQAGGELGYRCDGCPYAPGQRFGAGYGAGDPALTSIRIRLHNFFRDNGDGTLTWGLVLSDGTTNEFTVPGSFPEGEVRVVFKDHNYTPLKSPSTLLPETTFTWHWDNLHVLG